MNKNAKVEKRPAAKPALEFNQESEEIVPLKRLLEIKRFVKQQTTVQVRKDIYEDLAEHAVEFRLPVEVLVNAVLEAFNRLAEEDHCVSFPLMLSQQEAV